MSDRRLIFYNDARHSHMYCYEPPMRPEDAWAPVDEVAGTGVDTFAYGLGLGPSMFHDTKVGEVMGSHLDTFAQEVEALRDESPDGPKSQLRLIEDDVPRLPNRGRRRRTRRAASGN